MKKTKEIIVLVIMVLLTGMVWGADIDVTKPTQVTSNSYYERGNSLLKYSSEYWVFYGRSEDFSGNYGSGNPDNHHYVIYYKKASTVADLAIASPQLVPNMPTGANKIYQGQTACTEYGGKIYLFATDMTYGGSGDIVFWTWDGSSWSTMQNTGFDGHHLDALAHGDSIYLCWNAGSAANVASYDGTSWSSAYAIQGCTVSGPITRLYEDSYGDMILYFSNGWGITPDVYYFYTYNDGTSSWPITPGASLQITEPSGVHDCDPLLTQVDGSGDYIFIWAPWDDVVTKQWLYSRTASTLAGLQSATTQWLTCGGYSATLWVDMWPRALTDGSDIYTFYGSEANGTDRGTGNIYMLKLDWTMSNDHFCYIQNAIDQATGTTINVAVGTYYEDVQVSKGLTLTTSAMSGATIDGGIWIKDIHTFISPITVENFTIENGTSIDATHDYGIKISGDIGLADQAIVDMHIVNNTLVNCGKTDDVTAEVWWNAAIFYDANHFGALGSRYDTYFTVTGEISHNTILNDLGDPDQRTQLGIGVRSGRNMEINYNDISGNVAEGIHHWGPVNTTSTGDYEINHNTIDLSGWMGDYIGNNPRGIWSYAPQSSISYNTIVSNWIGIVLTYWDDTYWGGGSAGPNYGLTVSQNVIHPPPGDSMSVGLRISGNNSNITDNEIYGATDTLGYGVGLLFEGWGHPEWGERTECAHNTFEGNYIHDNYNGIWTWDPPYNNTFDNVFYNNSIEDNTSYGLYNGNDTTTVDASSNWWGTNTPTGVVAEVSVNVDYTPWLDDGTDTEPGIPGFQGDFSVLNVDDDSPQTGTTTRIQEGVDLVTGSTVNMAAGTYEEQVVVDKNMTLIGAGKDVTVIESPVTLTEYFTTSADNYPIIYILDATNVNIEELTVDGLGRGNDNYRFVGIGFWNAGGSVNNVHLTGVRDEPFSGAQHGVSIYSSNDTDGPYTINVSGVDIDDMQKTGMALSGNGLTANVSNCIVTGQGPTDVTAQNGIQIGFGAGGTVIDCSVTGIAYTGSGWIASGMLFYLGTTVDVSGTCSITNSQSNIVFQGTNGSVDGATVTTSGVNNEEGVSIRDYGYTMIGIENLSFNPVSPLMEEWKKEPGQKGEPTTVSLSNMNLTGVHEPASYGIAAWSIGDNVTVTVDYCTIQDWEIGLVAYESGSTVDVTADHNTIASNDLNFWSNAALTQDAEQNYWGTVNYLAIAALIDGDVDFDPWCNSDFSYCGYISNITEVWVDDDYCDGCANDGHTWDYDAFDNIQAGVNAVADGGIVNVAEGTYTENIVIAKSLDLIGASSSTTIIDGNNIGNTVMITSSDVTLSGFKVTGGYANGGSVFTPYGGVVINGNSGTSALTGINILDNIIDGNDGNGIYISAAGDGGAAGNVAIIGCQISNNGGSNNCAGISLTYPSYSGPEGTWDEWRRPKNILIESDTVFNCSSYGMYINAGKDNIIRLNDIFNNTKYGLQLVASMPCTEIPCEYTTVEGNDIHDNTRNGVKLTSYNQHNTFTGNTIHNNGYGGTSDRYKYGFLFQDGNNNTIQNNTITGNALGGLYLWGKGDPSYTWYSTTDNIVTGNTISNHTETGGHGIYIPALYGNPNSGFLNSNINENKITNNSAYGFENVDATQIIDATENWWGSYCGPYHPTSNPNGEGNEVSDYVDFEPWCDSTFTICHFTTDPPDTVWVDDDYTPSGENNGHFWCYDAFDNIQAGVDAVADNGMIYVSDGTYFENVVINKILTLEAGSLPVIDGNNTGHCIEITADGVTIDGFELTNGWNGIFSNDHDNCIFKNNTIHDVLNTGGYNGMGILFWGDADNNQILDNTIYNNDRQGIFIGYENRDSFVSTGNIISGNMIYDNGRNTTGEGPDPSEYGIQLWNGDNNTITGNTCYGHNDWEPWGPGNGYFGQGIYLIASNNNVVENNTFYDNGIGSVCWQNTGLNTYNENKIFDNYRGLVNYDASITVNAENNWWGSYCGPYNPTSNPNGEGNEVSDYVDFEPWCDSTFTICHFTTDPPVEVWVDDDYTETGYNDGHYWCYDAFDNIQAGVSAVAAGGTVNVAAGTYTEVGQIVIDKNLTIVGAGTSSTIVMKNEDTGDPSSGNDRGWLLVNSGYSLSFSGVTLDGDTRQICIAVLSFGDVTIEDCEIKNIAWTPESYYGRGACLYSGTANSVNQTTFTNIYRIGVFTFGSGVSSVITGCNYTGKGQGDWLDYAFEVGGGATATISNNTITNCSADESGWVSAGILATTYYGTGTSVIITGNDISTSNSGIAIGYGATDVTVASITDDNLIHNNDVGIGTSTSPDISLTVNGNAIYDNTDFGIEAANGPLVDAESNWWGDASGPALGTLVTGQKGANFIQPSDMFEDDSQHIAQPVTKPIPFENTKDGKTDPGLTTYGSGDAVTSNVDYSPWWGDNYVGDTHETPWIWYVDTNNNSTIQEGIDIATDGDLINLAEDTFINPINIENRIGLTLCGVDMNNSIFQPTSTLSWAIPGYPQYDSRGASMRIVNSIGIKLTNMTIDLDLVKANNVAGILYWNSTGEISNNEIKNNCVPDASGGYYEIVSYIRAPDYSENLRADILIKGNNFTKTGRLAVVTHDYVHAVIDSNVFDQVIDDFGYAIEMGSISTGAISNNIIRNYDTFALSDSSSASGIYIENAFTWDQVEPISKPVVIEDNEIYNCQFGMWIGNGYDGFAGNVDISATIENNNIHENSGGAFIEDEDKEAGSSVTTNFSGDVVSDNDDVGVYFYTNGDGEIHATFSVDTIRVNTIGIFIEDNVPEQSNSIYDIAVNDGGIYGNSSYGINNATTIVVNAENNWWGHNTGPFHPDSCPATGLTNPDGQGDQVTNYVDYDPWSYGICSYVPGDINGDGGVIGSDVTYGVRYFKGIGNPPPDSCWNDSTNSWLYAAGDVNGNCGFTGSDITYLVSFFKGINPPPQWCPQTPPSGPLSAGRRHDKMPITTHKETNRTSVKLYQ